ncbi:MAG TPA: SDR family oxidoreductase [Acidimicrobiales bacterium]|jgi:3-oxoacyl-[acyl-carrier protein] reductase|nr:SDR family oxidoreductase [Acidimicrobiales bacterium]
MPQDTIVVTGAGRGIGKATAQLVAEQDVNLVIADANEEWLAATASHCEGNRARVLAVPFDQRSRVSIDRLFERVDERFGKIDALANVVGVYPAEQVTEMADELWDTVILTNLTGVFYCCRAALSRMLKTGGGSIVNVASILAAVPRQGFAAYAASKGGIESFSRVLAVEAAPTVRVNVVAPGPVVPSADNGPGPPEAVEGGEHATTAHRIPLARAGQAAEIAAGITFLISGGASFMTGQVLRINGGIHMA